MRSPFKEPASWVHYDSGDKNSEPLCGTEDRSGMFSRGEHLVGCPECRKLMGWPAVEDREQEKPVALTMAEWQPRVGPKEVQIARAWIAAVEELRYTSQCARMGHACVLVSADLREVLSMGYNGPASGLPNQCERPEEAGNCGCIHAEANAVAKVGDPTRPKVAFISGHPCENCAKLLMQTNVVLVIYPGPAHRAVSGPRYLDKRGIVHGTLNDEWVLGMLDELGGRTGLSRIYPPEFRPYGVPRAYYDKVLKDGPTTSQQ